VKARLPLFFNTEWLPAAFAAIPAVSAEAKPGGAIPRVELQALATRAENELKGNILPFWLKYTRDRERGGFYGLIDQDMTVHKDAPRGALLTSRILWTFSAAYRIYHDPDYREMAQWAYRDLMDKFRDREFGGLYWSVTVTGEPVETQKQIYGQVFGIYALAEYYRITGEKPALDEAIALYQLIEKNAHDGKQGGYFDALDRQWQRVKQNVLGPTSKSQNSHIHIMEAFTNLLRVWPDAGLHERQRELIELMMTRIIDPKTHHLVLFMKDDWTPVGDEFSYGHDIELAWLLVEAAEQLGEAALIARAKAEAVAIARVTAAEGLDHDGSVYNEGTAHGVTNANKDWWPQAEAAVGFLNAYQLTLDPKYFTAAQRSWDYIEAKFVDRKYGDWYESLDRDGTPKRRSKSSVWKCPYHNSRSCLELVERLHGLIGDPGAPAK